MDAASFKAALPSGVGLLWDKIESGSGLKIGVGDLPQGAPPGTRMGCGIQTYPAIAVLRKKHDRVYPAAALHELLHLERYVIDRVPTIAPKREDCAELANDIENYLEHLVIVPRQSDWGLREEARWNGMISQNWDVQQAGHPPIVAERLAKLAWLNTALCTDPEIEKRARKIIDSSSFSDTVYQFRDGVMDRLDNKINLANYTIRNLGLPTEVFCIWGYTNNHMMDIG